MSKCSTQQGGDLSSQAAQGSNRSKPTMALEATSNGRYVVFLQELTSYDTNEACDAMFRRAIGNS